MDGAIRLQALNRRRHEAAFLDNLIDVNVVHTLNENDFEPRLLLGDRRRVQEAIARKKPPRPQPSGRVRAS